MDEKTSDLFREVGEEELFHLQNGTDIASIRELAIKLDEMSQEVFKYHVNKEKNDFSIWVKDVFKDENLSAKIKDKKDKKEIKKIIEEQLVQYEENELKKYGVNLPRDELKPLEEYIEHKLEQGLEDREIKAVLTAKGWNKKIVELVLEGNKNPYKQYNKIRKIENIEEFHKKLEKLKKEIIKSIMEGKGINEIKEYLKRQKWHENIIDLIFFDIYKPHPNIKKLSEYIIHKVKNENKDIEEIKKTLIKLGWKEYIIDSVIYGINEPENKLDDILKYVEEYNPKDSQEIKKFLLKMGWSATDVVNALRKKELHEQEKKIKTHLNMNTGKEIKKITKNITKTLLEIKETNLTKEIWKKTIKNFKKKNITELKFNGEEVTIEDNKTNYYNKKDFELIEKKEKEKIEKVLFQKSTQPILIEIKNKYLIIPQIIKRKCLVCKKEKPITELKEVIMWDENRVNKITKYVCPEHEKQLQNFLGLTKVLKN